MSDPNSTAPDDATTEVADPRPGSDRTPRKLDPATARRSGSRRWTGWTSTVGSRPWAVIALIVAVGSILALIDARQDGDAAARDQVLGIATSLADAPSTASAIESGRATEVLQPMTELVRTHTDTPAFAMAA